MEHLIIQAYSDDKFRSKQGGQITILLNPENIKTGKRIRYNKDKQLGAIGKNNIFDRYDSETSHSILPLTVQVLLKEHYKAILLPPRSKR